MLSFVWPPPHQIRYSTRAKRITIKICPKQGLQLILPPNIAIEQARKFLEEKKDWVLKHQTFVLPTPLELPTTINLHASKQIFAIRYEPVACYRQIKLISLPDEIVLYGPIMNKTLCFDAMINWVHIKAEQYLSQWLIQKSKSCNLGFNQFIIRKQNTRWGSCTIKKNISLNYKLMFLPYHLVEYVIIHELCHTVYLDHSANFWKLVAKYFPNYLQARKELRRVENYIPKWITAN